MYLVKKENNFVFPLFLLGISEIKLTCQVEPWPFFPYPQLPNDSVLKPLVGIHTQGGLGLGAGAEARHLHREAAQCGLLEPVQAKEEYLLSKTVQYELSESKQDGESFNVGEAWCGVRRGPCRWKAHCEVFESKRSKGNRDV